MADLGVLGEQTLGTGTLGAIESAGGASPTTLTPTLFTNTSTFGTHTETLTLTTTTLTNTSSFGTHTETLGLSAAHFTNSSSFGTPAISLSLSHTLYSNTSSFGAHTETLTLAQTLFNNSQSFGTPLLAESGLFPSPYTNTSTFGTHTIGTSGLYATAHTNTSTFGTHTQSLSLVTAAVINAQSFGSHSLSLSVTPQVFVNTAQFGTPAASFTLTASLFTNTSTFHTPAVSLECIGSATILLESMTSASAGTEIFYASGTPLISTILAAGIGSSTYTTVSGTANITLLPPIATTPVNYLNNLKDAIIATVEDDYEDLEDCLSQIIRRAELRIFRDTRGAIGFRKYSSGSLTQEVAAQAIVPSEAKSILGLRVKETADTRYYNLKSKDESYINKLNLTLSSDRPKFYCVTSNDADETIIIVAPKPASNDSYKLEYRVLNSIVDNPTGTWLAEHAYDLLFAGTMVEALMFIKADTSEIKLALTTYMEKLQNFRSQQILKTHDTEYRNTESRM